MKRMFFALLFVAANAAWCSTSFAQQITVGPGPTPLSATGVTDGVQMTAPGPCCVVTLTIGNEDVFTNNSSGGVVTNPLLPAIATDTASQGFVVFNGSSNVFGSAGTSGLILNTIKAGANGATVNFWGGVVTTTLDVTGTGTVNFLSGTTNAAAMSFANDGTIGLAPNVAITGALTTLADNTGTLMLGSGSQLTGAIGAPTFSLKNITVAGGSNTTGVSATIVGAVFAHQFDLGPNTLNINGALNITGTGVINTQINSATVYGNIIPTGASSPGSALQVNVLVAPGAVIPVGTLFNIVNAASGTSGIPITVTDPTQPGYTFAAVPLAGNVHGAVQIIMLTSGAVVPGGPGGPPPPPTPIEQQLSPSAPDVVAPLVTFQGNREFQELALSHLDDVMCGQVREPYLNNDNSTCQKNRPQSGWWLKGFGYWGNQDADGAFPGYDSKIAGTMAGFDMPLDGNTRAGLGVGYARSWIDGKTFDTSTDANTYQAMAYIEHAQGPWYVYGDASFGWNDYSSTRHIAFPGVDQTAQGDYSGQAYTGFVTTGYHFFTQGFTITPLASLQYTHVNVSSYSETGAGALNLNVASQSYDFLESGLGATVARPFSFGTGTLVPEIHAKWLHELINPTLQATSAFTGSPSSTTPGFNPADDTLNIGAGLTFLSCNCSARTWSLEGVYDHYFADGYSADQGMVKFTGRF
jgi:outer membrane autotransporter protein